MKNTKKRITRFLCLLAAVVCLAGCGAAGDSGGGFLPVQISTASGDYRAAYMVSENTAQLTFLALDGAFLL